MILSLIVLVWCVVQLRAATPVELVVCRGAPRGNIMLQSRDARNPTVVQWSASFSELYPGDYNEMDATGAIRHADVTWIAGMHNIAAYNNTDSGKVVWTRRIDDPYILRAVSASPVDALVAIAGIARSATIANWILIADVYSGDTIHKIDAKSPVVNLVAWSLDAEYFAFSRDSVGVRITRTSPWATRQSSADVDIVYAGTRVSVLAFTDTGLAIAGYRDDADTSVVLFGLDGTEKWKAVFPASDITALLWYPATRVVLAGGVDSTIRKDKAWLPGRDISAPIVVYNSVDGANVAQIHLPNSERIAAMALVDDDVWIGHSTYLDYTLFNKRTLSIINGPHWNISEFDWADSSSILELVA